MGKEEMIGFIFLLVSQILITCLLVKIEKIRKQYWIYYLVLVGFNYFLLINVKDWNEGSMAGSSYLIPLFKPASDALNGFLLLSIFTGFIPLLIYLAFIGFLPFVCNSVFFGKLNKD